MTPQDIIIRLEKLSAVINNNREYPDDYMNMRYGTSASDRVWVDLWLTKLKEHRHIFKGEFNIILPYFNEIWYHAHHYEHAMWMTVGFEEKRVHYMNFKTVEKIK